MQLLKYLFHRFTNIVCINMFIYLLLCFTSQVLEVSGQCIAAPQSPEALLYTSYKQRSDEFRRLFKEVPESEKLIADYTCALQKDILLQGRIYLTENCLCFYSQVFRGTKVINMQDIISLSREKTAKWIPNAIQISTNSEKLFFSSFSAREKSYLGMFRLWQIILMDKVISFFLTFFFFASLTLFKHVST
uniref:GRAM domain-containing protein n=1 Tax=Sinocyclocheilus rhinocerous TaxID=307959 RepID=A0A673FW90_9TELE